LVLEKADVIFPRYIIINKTYTEIGGPWILSHRYQTG